MKQDIQEIIRTANQEGLGRPSAQTFLFLWSYGENVIDTEQDEIAAESGVKTRTVRAHLRDLRRVGWITSRKRNSNPSDRIIELKRFRH